MTSSTKNNGAKVGQVRRFRGWLYIIVEIDGNNVKIEWLSPKYTIVSGSMYNKEDVERDELLTSLEVELL